MDDEAGPHARVVIIDDHLMFSESLARLLSAEDGISVVGTTDDAEHAVEFVVGLRPNVVLVDYLMPGRDGVAIAADIKRQVPDTMVVMLTGHVEDRVLLAAVDAGCSGFLAKQRAAAEVTAAVRAAAAGEALISPAQMARLLPLLSRTNRSTATELTQREREVLDQLALGGSNKVIAAELHVSVNTVRNYVQSVLTKLEAHSRLEAVAIAVRQGLVDFPRSG